MPLPQAPQAITPKTTTPKTDVFDDVATSAPASAASGGDVFDQVATATPTSSSDAPFTAEERQQAIRQLQFTENKGIASGRVPPKESDIADWIKTKRRGDLLTPGQGLASAASSTIPMVGGIVGGAGGFAAGAATDAMLQDVIRHKPADINKAAETGVVNYVAGKAFETALPLISRLAMRVPPVQKAIEGIFRNIPSDSPGYRDQVIAAAWDLQQMAKDGTIPPRAAGGIRNPEMYYRQVESAIDKRLSSMYQNEYLGQINLAAKEGVGVHFTEHPEVMRQALRQVVRSSVADAPERAIAQQLIDDPTARVSIQDAAKLAKAVNAQLREFEAASGEKQYVSAMKSATKAALKRFDIDAGNVINERLESLGQPGIRGYERRYATLSEIKRELATSKNALERMQKMPGTVELVSSRGRALKNILKGNPGAGLEDAIELLRNMPDLVGMSSSPKPVVYHGEDAGFAPIRSARVPEESIQTGGGKGAPRRGLPPPPSPQLP